MLPNERDARSSAILGELRRLPAIERDAVVEKILRADPELEPVLPQLLGLYGDVKRARRFPFRRDSLL